MRTTPLVELVYLAGCPHVEAARTALRAALGRAGLAPVWREWDQTTPGAPAHVHGLGSPTILVEGRDVTGTGAPATGHACRADGVPAPEVIVAALAAATGAA
jgi:hypothetical protein